MINDQLSGLFGTDPNSPTPVSLRQGVVQAWDSSTGDNEVLVGGGLLVNVPVLTSESVSLAVGDVVSLATDGANWLLLGRVTTPGDPGTVPSWPTDIIALDQSVTTLNTVTIPAVQADVLVAQGTADTAQVDATQAILDAAAADAAAAQAALDAAAADATATQAAIDAAAADAAAAQAALDAAAAQAAADLAQAAADAAAAQVAAVQGELDTLNDVTLPALQTELDAILPITETDIADDAITTPKIAANAVTANEIAANTITANEMAADSITTNQLTADAIDGMDINGVTITGVLLRTATASVGRVEVGEDPLQPGSTDTEIRIYSADPAETESAAFSGIAGSPGNLEAQVKGFSTAGISAPKLTLRTTSAGLPAEAAAEVEADHFSVFAPQADFSGTLNVTGALTKGTVPVVTTTDTQTLTNKNLTSGTNTFPTSLATLTGTQTLTNKDLSSGTNTLPTSVVTLTGSQALTNKNLTGAGNTFPTSLVTLTGSQTLTNKTLTDPVITETEIWHVVGNGTTGLGTTFASGSADATYPPSFRKDANGVVHIRGVVVSTLSAQTTIFTLPAGYRPSAATPGYTFIIYMNPAGSIGRVVVQTAGQVQIQRLIGASSTGFQIDCSFTTR